MNQGIFWVGDKVWVHDEWTNYDGPAQVTGVAGSIIDYQRPNGSECYVSLNVVSGDTIRHLTDHDPKCFGWPGCDGCSDTERPAIVPPAPSLKVGDVVRMSCEHSPLDGFGGVVASLAENFVTVDFGADAAHLHEAARHYLCDPKQLTLLPAAPAAPAPKGDYHARKHDKGKSRIDLIPGEALEGVGEVLEYGARKYAEESWQDVPDAEKRYRGALLRHMIEIKKHGLLSRDPESGKLHIDHAATNAAFLQYFARKETK